MAEHLDTITDQTIIGAKTFSTDPILSDGNTAPTQDGSDAAYLWPALSKVRHVTKQGSDSNNGLSPGSTGWVAK